MERAQLDATTDRAFDIRRPCGILGHASGGRTAPGRCGGKG
jgi:hypothetical protein